MTNSPDFTSAAEFCPDDIAVGHLNNDTNMDFAIAERLNGACSATGTSKTRVFINNGSGASYTELGALLAPSGVSSHDVFFIDVDNDGDQDIFTVNESGSNNSRLWLNNGASPFPGFSLAAGTFNSAIAGSAGDFNQDGFIDFVLGGSNSTWVYTNNGSGSFTQSNNIAPTGSGTFYDFELSDLNNDGYLDILGASIGGATNGEAVQWLNNKQASPSFTASTNAFPNRGDYQLLSIDTIDFDSDGDMDVYMTGADGQNFGCFGCVPNQFYENLTIGPLSLSVSKDETGLCPGSGSIWVVTATASGGDGSYSFSWTGGGGIDISPLSGPTENPNDVIITAEDHNGGVRVEVTSGDGQNASQLIDLDNKLCSGGGF